MYLVRVVPGEKPQKSALSNGMFILMNALLSNTVLDAKEFSRRCCQAGLCPLVLREKMKGAA